MIRSIGMVTGSLCAMILLQLVTGALVWITSPWVMVSFCASLAGLTILWCGARIFIASLPSRSTRAFTLLLWQAPGFICGAWTLLQISGFMKRDDTPPFILQTWMMVMAPWWSLIPGYFIREVGLYLWFIGFLPFGMTAIWWFFPCRPRHSKVAPSP